MIIHESKKGENAKIVIVKMNRNDLKGDMV